MCCCREEGNKQFFRYSEYSKCEKTCCLGYILKNFLIVRVFNTGTCQKSKRLIVMG